MSAAPVDGCEDCEMWAAYGGAFGEVGESFMLSAHIQSEHVATCP